MLHPSHDESEDGMVVRVPAMRSRIKGTKWEGAGEKNAKTKTWDGKYPEMDITAHMVLHVSSLGRRNFIFPLTLSLPLPPIQRNAILDGWNLPPKQHYALVSSPIIYNILFTRDGQDTAVCADLLIALQHEIYR